MGIAQAGSNDERLPLGPGQFQGIGQLLNMTDREGAKPSGRKAKQPVANADPASNGP